MTFSAADFIRNYEPDFRCRCPEPDRPGGMHRAPIECAQLAPGETIEEWRGRRFEGKRSPARDLQLWSQQMEWEGYVELGRPTVDVLTAECGDGHDWDRVVLGSEEERRYW